MDNKKRKFSDTIAELGNYGTSALLSASPGMRIIKTLIAVFLCLMIDAGRSALYPYNAAIAAIVCLQPTPESTRRTALNRALGSLLAGLYAYLFIRLFADKAALDPEGVFYLFLVSLGLLPLMLLILRLGLKNGFTISAIVYLMICIGSGRQEPLRYTLYRVTDTLIGIAAALFGNWLPFLNRWGKSLDEVKDRAGEDKRKAAEKLGGIFRRDH